MRDDTDTTTGDGLSADENAYFESGGETELAEAAPKPEPTPEPAKVEAEPEAKDAAPEDKIEGDGKDKVTYVRQEALHEERERRKGLERQLRELKEAQARQDGMLQALKPQDGAKTDGAKQASQWTPQEIEQNPVGFIKAQAEERAADAKRAAEEREFQSRAQQISDIGMRHSQEFVKTTPHFFDTKAEDGSPVQGAYGYLRQKAAERIAADYPDASTQQIQSVLNMHELNLIQEAMRDGKNSAAEVYRLAVEQGYQPPKPKAPAISEAERIAKAEAAQRGGKSLGAVPAGGASGELTIETLAGMTDKEFAEATKGDKWERLMGGRG